LAELWLLAPDPVKAARIFPPKHLWLLPWDLWKLRCGRSPSSEQCELPEKPSQSRRLLQREGDRRLRQPPFRARACRPSCPVRVQGQRKPARLFPEALMSSCQLKPPSPALLRPHTGFPSRPGQRTLRRQRPSLPQPRRWQGET
jgi:hypothetical protein